jgi:hypothetical protein
MPDDHLLPEDELSEELLTQVSGADGNNVRPIMQVLTTNEQIEKSDKNVHKGFDAGKNEISIETLEN